MKKLALLAIGLVGLVIAWRSARPKPFERDIVWEPGESRPAGWNRAVLSYFHDGPEGRDTGGDFADAFRERAEDSPS